MKITTILSAILLTATLLASCGNNNAAKSGTSDTAKSDKKRSDTSVVTGNQRNIENDSVSGDPAAKGAADPNAKLPKQ